LDDGDEAVGKPLSSLAVDEFEISCLGGIPMDEGGIARVNNPGNIGELLNPTHFDDVDTNSICNLINQHVQSGPLPRDHMLNNVKSRGLKQPILKQWLKLS
jgi:hypothetical protein